MPPPRLVARRLMLVVEVVVLYMAPFLSMLAMHSALGLSDALMVEAGPDARAAYGYNAATVVSFYAGLFAAVHHLSAPGHRSWRWIVGKLFLLWAIDVIGLVTL